MPGSRYLLCLLLVAIIFLVIGCSAGEDEEATAIAATESSIVATNQAVEVAAAEIATSEATTREAEEEAARQATAELEQTVAAQASADAQVTADAQATAEAEMAAAVATNQALESANATIAAEATAAAEAAATAAYEATRTAFEAGKIAHIEAVKDDTPFVTLEEGALVHDEDEEPESQAADVNLANFVVETQFAFEPGETDLDNGDFGLQFHVDGDNFACLLINQDGAWQLVNGEDGDVEIVQEGQTSLVANDWNEITVYIEDDQGFFTLNGEYVDALDLDQSQDPGDIALVTAFNPDSEVAEAILQFKELTIWSLDPIPPTPTPAPTSPPPPPPPQKFPETPVKPFDRDEFVSYVGRIRDSLRSYVSEMDLMETTYKPGDCGTFYGWIRLWRAESPFYNDVPPAFASLHREYRSMLSEVVTLSQEIQDVCDAGGGFVSDETIDAIIGFLVWAYPRSEAMVSEASALPG